MTISSSIGRIIGRDRAAIIGMLAATMAASGGTMAAPLSGETVSATFVSGPSDFDTLPASAEAFPTVYVIGFSGVPILNVGLDENGLISITPNGQSCGTGCGYSVNSTFEFTLDAGAPAILDLDTTQADAELGVTLNLVDDHDFELSVGSGTGVTNTDTILAQLSFAPVPEPGTLGLLGFGAVALGALRRRLRAAGK